MLSNFLILMIQIAIITGLSLLFLRLGEKALNAWLCVLAVLMNVFVLKQINVFKLDVTATDAIAVGYMLGLNLIREYFGAHSARTHVFISILVSFGFLALSFTHLLYIPNGFDTAQSHYEFLLKPMPRLIFASIFSFALIQVVDLAFFGYLREKLDGKYLVVRLILTLILSQVLDTFLFSFIGLYGLVGNLMHIIILSLIFKIIVIGIISPLAQISKKMMGEVKYAFRP